MAVFANSHLLELARLQWEYFLSTTHAVLGLILTFGCSFG